MNNYNTYTYSYTNNFMIINKIFIKMNKDGDWGLGIGDWGLGSGVWGVSPIPNPHSPLPNPQSHFMMCIKNSLIP